MKALVLKEYGLPMDLIDVATPKPAPGEVLVRIVASGVNPLDIKIKNGQAAHAQSKLPAILGIDMSGIVDAVGEGVNSFKIGDEVYGMVGGIAGVQGTLAEYVSADADLLAHKPKNLTFREAAALPLIFITAWEGLVDKSAIKQGQKVLIQGGAGGVGHIVVQLAKAMGANVYATVSSDDFEFVSCHGATPINYQENLLVYIEKYTNNEGFDVIYDTVGGEVLSSSFGLVKRYTGHVVSILGWGSHSLAPLSFRGGSYSGIFTLYPLISGEGRAKHGDILKRATELVEKGLIKPKINNEHYSLDTIDRAYNAIEGKTNIGKLIIDIESNNPVFRSFF